MSQQPAPKEEPTPEEEYMLAVIAAADRDVHEKHIAADDGWTRGLDASSS